MHFVPDKVDVEGVASRLLPAGDVSPHDVQDVLGRLSGNTGIVVMLDEFDRLPEETNARRMIADTIKGISDQDIAATIIIIGVGESVADLLREHESITRHVVEIPVPRLTAVEQAKILHDRLPSLGLSIDNSMIQLIVSISKGLPFYVHLLGQKASVAALTREDDKITMRHAGDAITLAIDDSKRSLRDAYYQATRSPHSSSRYPHTLAACALAHCDEFGYFKPIDVEEPLSRILGEKKTSGTFVDRLKKMADQERGCVLLASGKKYDMRYRFRDPLMQPFVLLNGVHEELIPVDALARGEDE